MSLLDPTLMQRLNRSRLVTIRAAATSGIGERPSRGKGPGMDFADHREYQLGDDIRFLDRNVYLRLGQHVVKQFTINRQLPISILVDGSGSMSFGKPNKLRRAKQLASALAYVALSGGDRLRLGVFDEKGIRWHAPLEGVQRSTKLVNWLERIESEGHADFRQVARESIPRLPRDGVLVIVSDWLGEEWKAAMQMWHAAHHELIGIHLLSPQELEPERLGPGPVHMVDVETGRVVEASLDQVQIRRYRFELEEWRGEIKDTFSSLAGRYFFTRTDDLLEHVLLSRWRREGLIR